MKCYKISILAIAVMAVLFGLASCSDDVKTPLQASSGLLDNSGYNTLSFHWGKVEGARQYSYQLRETESGKVVSTAVTKFTNVTFTALKPSTEYTLTVYAYAAIDSDRTSAEPIVLTGRTSDLVKVESPVPSMTRMDNSLIFEWQPVDGFSGYEYSLTNSKGDEIGSGVSYTNAATFSDLQTDIYYFSLSTLVDLPGFIASDPYVMKIDFEHLRIEQWRKSGKYTSSLLGKSWETTIVAYDDDSYDILSWYEVEGYDISFSSAGNGTNGNLSLPEDKYAYDSADGSYFVATGRSDLKNVRVYISDNRSAMDGNQEMGSVALWVGDGSKTGLDTFDWMPGAYARVTMQICLNSTGNQIADDFQTLVVYEDGKYRLSNFFYCGWPLTFTLPASPADGKQYDLGIVTGTYVPTGTGYCCLLDPDRYAADPDGYYTRMRLDNYNGTGSTEYFAYPTVYTISGYTYGKYEAANDMWHIRVCFDGMMESNGWNWTWFDTYFDMPNLASGKKLSPVSKASLRR